MIVQGGEHLELKAYHNSVKRFARIDCFAWEHPTRKDAKGRPVVFRQNPPENPCPWKGPTLKGFITRQPVKLSRDVVLMNHLLGERAFFHTNWGFRKRYALYALDFDAETGTSYARSRFHAEDVVANVFPRLLPFIEPGRSHNRPPAARSGAYAWFRVDWSYGRTTHPLIRRMYEYALQRYISEIYPKGSADGVHFDCLGGSSSWEELNDQFDEGYADVIPSGCARSRGARYLSSKRFYGIDSHGNIDRCATFEVDWRLEPKRINHGKTVITGPCFGAWSDRRDNNLDDYLKWIEHPAGLLIRDDLDHVLPDDVVEHIHQVEDDIRAGRTPKLNYRTSSGTVAAPHEQDLAANDCWLAMQEASRSALRESQGDVEAAVPLAVRKYEATGLATGFTSKDCQKRYKTIRRIVEFYERTFDPEKALGTDPLWFDGDDISELALQIQTRCSKSEMKAKSKRLNPRSMARVACYIAKRVVRNRGMVKAADIPQHLANMRDYPDEKRGHSLSPSTIKKAIELLREHRILTLYQEFQHFDGKPSRCRRYRLHPHSLLLNASWIQDFIEPWMIASTLKHNERTLQQTRHPQPPIYNHNSYSRTLENGRKRRCLMTDREHLQKRAETMVFYRGRDWSTGRSFPRCRQWKDRNGNRRVLLCTKKAGNRHAA